MAERLLAGLNALQTLVQRAYFHIGNLTPENLREEFVRRITSPPREITVEDVDNLGISFILGDMRCFTELGVGKLSLCLGSLQIIIDVKKKYTPLGADDRDAILLYRILAKMMRLMTEYERIQPPQEVFEVEVFTDVLRQIEKMRTYARVLPQDG